MKFITDENIYVPIVEELKNLGHNVLDIKEQNLIGTEDSDIYKMALDQHRILLSMDKDFSDILKYPPGEHYRYYSFKSLSIKYIDYKKNFLERIPSSN